ncbi:phage tail tape measure protein [Rhodococcus qingshengii]|uniref:phage tail tape measure protein n=1 Tax=Rhodococcus qingshengii TaxID=334542 RepID=UPI0014560DAA|nr:phage tail tape measure protein [Rhodococcus qingshengii]
MPTIPGIACEITRQVSGPIRQAGQAAGASFGNAMAEGVKKTEAEVVSATRKLSTEREKAADSIRKVEIAELKLQELRDSGNAKASQIKAAEDAVIKARQNSNRQVGAAEAAETQLTRARERAEEAARAAANATDELTDSQQGAADAADDLASSQDGAGRSTELFGQGLGKIAGIAAGAVVGVMGISAAFDGIGAAIEKNDINSKLKVQLGLTAQEASAAGEAAGNLYYKGFGENYEQVNDAVAAVGSSLAELGTTSTEDVEYLTQSAMNLSDVFGVDVAESTAVAGQLIKDGLAGDATEAFDLVVGSMQQVPVAMQGEILPVMNEYSKHFAALGLEGEQAFGLVVGASQDGAIGMDKVGDALKEFTIRATDMSTGTGEAFAAVDVDMAKMTESLLAGGPAAGEAFSEIVAGLQEIKDPGEQASAALALFGSPLEDLGTDQIPAFLDQLTNAESGLGDFEEATHMMNEDMASGPGNALEILKRSLEQVFEALGPLMQPLADVIGKVTEAIGPMVEVLGGAMAGAVEALLPALAPLAETFGSLISALAPILPLVAELVGGIIEALAPALTSIIQALDPVIAVISEALMPIFEELGPILAEVAGTIAEGLVTAIEALAPFLPELFAAFGEIVKALLPLLPPLIQLAMSVMPLLVGIIQILLPIIVKVAELFGTVAGIVADLLVPIIETLTTVLTAITTFIADVFVGAFNLGKGAIQGVIDVFGWLKDKAGEVLGWVREKIDGFVDTVSGLKDRITSAASGMWDGIKEAFKSAINWILTKWNNLSIPLPEIKIAGKVLYDGGDINFPDIPLLAKGGVAGRRDDGRLFGPGTGTSDSILGIDELGIPTAFVANREGIVTEKAMDQGGAPIVAALNRGWTPSATDLHAMFPDLPRYAGGGQVESMEKIVGSRWPSLLQNGHAFSSYRNSNDHHGSGLAADFSNGGDAGTPEMKALAQFIADNYQSQTLELIHSPFDRNIKNGEFVGDGMSFYGAGLMAQHRNHVHWAVGEPVGEPTPQVVPTSPDTSTSTPPPSTSSEDVDTVKTDKGPEAVKVFSARDRIKSMFTDVAGIWADSAIEIAGVGEWLDLADRYTITDSAASDTPTLSKPEADAAVAAPSAPPLDSIVRTGADLYSYEIARAAKDMGLDREAATIGEATALVEAGDPLKMWANSKLPESLNLPHDAVGSDGTSTGLFQQQDYPEWGTLAQRMDPFESAKLFFSKLPANWQTMDPGAVAQSVQRSAFPSKYGEMMGRGKELVDSTSLFDTGGVWEPGTFGFNGLAEPEYVLKDAHWKVAESNISKVDELVSAGAGAGGGPRVQINNNQQVTLADQDSWQRDQASQQRLALMRFGG